MLVLLLGLLEHNDLLYSLPVRKLATKLLVNAVDLLLYWGEHPTLLLRRL